MASAKLLGLCVDIISANEFDKSGDHLAIGDRGGRVDLFEKTDTRDVQEKKVRRISEMNMNGSPAVGNGSSASSSTSASPRAYLPNGSHEKSHYERLSNDFSFPSRGFPSLRLPVVFSEGETFISADLQINLWNLEISNQSLNIVDVKAANMEDLTEVITSAVLHPNHCNTLAYSSSKGSIRLIDLRQSALCDRHSQLFEKHEAPGLRSFFTEIMGSISDIKFGKDGKHILSRDYMTLKLWDINMNYGPVATFQVHEHLRPRLCDLYENESIFDKFECCQSGDGLRVATGSYRYCVIATARRRRAPPAPQEPEDPSNDAGSA